MSGIIDEIRAEHRMKTRLLSLLEGEMEAFARGKRPDFELVRDVIDFLSEWGAKCHHPREEALLGALAERDPAARKAIGELEVVHGRLAGQLANMATAISSILMEVETSREAFVAMARNYLGRQKDHLAIEENVLLPMAERALSPQEAERLARETAPDEECLRLARLGKLLRATEEA